MPSTHRERFIVVPRRALHVHRRQLLLAQRLEVVAAAVVDQLREVLRFKLELSAAWSQVCNVSMQGPKKWQPP